MTGIYNADIEWFIRCGAVAQGERGTSAALLEMLKNGRPTGASGVPNTDLYSDRQLGWGDRPGEGEVARARRCAAIWHRLGHGSREVLMGRYDSRQWPPGVAGALGDLAGVVVVLVGSRRAASRIAKSEQAIAEHADELAAALYKVVPDLEINRSSWLDNEDGGSRNDERMDELRRAVEGKSHGDPEAATAATEALKKQAELESSAQPGILDSDWQCVVDACQSTKRDRAKQRREWLTEAIEALGVAHAEWDVIRVVIAEEWAA